MLLQRLCSSDNCLYSLEQSSINLLGLSRVDGTDVALPEKDDVIALEVSTITWFTDGSLFLDAEPPRENVEVVGGLS